MSVLFYVYLRARALQQSESYTIEKLVMALALNTCPVAALHYGLLSALLLEKLLSCSPVMDFSVYDCWLMIVELRRV